LQGLPGFIFRSIREAPGIRVSIIVVLLWLQAVQERIVDVLIDRRVVCPDA
jgi:hypothetical protein